MTRLNGVAEALNARRVPRGGVDVGMPHRSDECWRGCRIEASAHARTPGRFPRRQDTGRLCVRDTNGQALAYIYSRNNEAEARQTKMLTKDEARRIAINVAAAAGAAREGRSRLIRLVRELGPRMVFTCGDARQNLRDAGYAALMDSSLPPMRQKRKRYVLVQRAAKRIHLNPRPLRDAGCLCRLREINRVPQLVEFDASTAPPLVALSAVFLFVGHQRCVRRNHRLMHSFIPGFDGSGGAKCRLR